MTVREPNELRHLTPTITEADQRATPSTLPSPGTAPGIVRVPGAPSLPDWDPATLTRVVQLVANDMFGIDLGLVSPSTAAHSPFASGLTAPSSMEAPGGL